MIELIEAFNKSVEKAAIEAVKQGRATWGQQLIVGRVLARLDLIEAPIGSYSLKSSADYRY